MQNNTLAYLLYKWIRLKETNNTIAYIFKQLEYQNIAIYGRNQLSELCFNELNNNFLKVCVTDDINELSEYDCVIIIDFSRYYQIEKLMPKNIDIFSIREIVELTYFLCIDSKKISSLNNKINKFLVRLPKVVSEFKDNNIYESMASSIHFSSDVFSENPEYFRYLYNDIPEYNDDYINQVFQSPAIITKHNGEITHIDYKSEYINIINGERYTCNQPEKYSNRIFIYGDCYAFGRGTDDNRTIASYLQNYFPESRVINYGMLGAGGEHRCFDRPTYHCYNDNDIIIIFALYIYLPLSSKNKLFAYVENELRKNGIIYCDMLSVYDKRDDSMPFCIDYSHVNHRGYKIIADYLYEMYLSKINISNDISYHSAISNKEINFLSEENDGIKEYLSYLEREKFQDSETKKYGSIVMNVNPFTYGHRYLIEKALSHVDYLYIFLVEENKSAFSFQDRYNMITENIKDLPNVKVLKSGKYIISTITFPEYFQKDFQKEVAVDTSLDISIFASIIAPALNISIRFVGNEPFCNITKQYNNSMRDILPQYNIEFKELKRYEIDGVAVSASAVRKCLDNQDYDTLKKLVPEATFSYLKDKFMK